MLLYIQSKAYPGRTFVDIYNPSDTVARVRANLLHRLFEIGHSDHQFRLKYKGIYLRDAYTLEEYKLLNNAVIHMVPLNDVSEWKKDKRFHQSHEVETETEIEDIVQVALKSEIKILNDREKVLNAYKIMMLMQIVIAFLALFTNYWYFFFAYAFVLFVAIIFPPNFTRVNGWIGTNSVRRKEYMVVMITLSVLMMGAGIALFVLNIIELTSSVYPTSRCLEQIQICLDDARDVIQLGICESYKRRCYETSVWTSIYYILEILSMMATGIFCTFLLTNFRFTTGDYIEKYLVQTREFEQVMAAAKFGNVSQKRNAVFELATMASSADDNKFQIVTEGGFEVLISLALSSDLTTQEYATEAIAECLTVPALQDQFVSIGGMKTLTALLHVKNPRTSREAVTAVSYVVTDSDDNKLAVVADHGLDDLSYACRYTNNRRTLSTIFLDLAYFAETRASMATRNTPTEALICLLQRSISNPEELSDVDVETVVLTLQTLELLAIESPTLIASQNELLIHLLGMPSTIIDKKVQLLSAKLLLYFTQTPESTELLCNTPELTDKLLYYAHSNDPDLLKVLATIAFHVTQPFKHRERLISDGFLEFLNYLQGASNERDTWNLTDEAIANLQNKENPNDDIKKVPIRPSSASSMTSSASSQP